ncbi:28156_t:CDS:2 [Dentiscutata erythropus]|uniref:28156_t:CDS:1 n=1 Tax=Dentiscutata erythropus TaxID=1348616 RepID=A0A9N8ZFL7_9GLOM|nr:28156_t:CDS:2 [Dentiscutata erythropus]
MKVLGKQNESEKRSVRELIIRTYEYKYTFSKEQKDFFLY